ncbi:unnamed protein product [Prorocentrum cordatum]|uniref:Uncharacterized protein n=1 Tax=Prorocentrum cordatum TaxID=2364126 RepID=A0ABN9QES2_9DINO|nr:unnamed protein product [Polarella glacialis]
MLLLIVSLLGHPAMLLFHALHWSVGGHFDAAVLEALKGVLPESGQAQLEVLSAGAPEWAAWSYLNGTLHADSRRLSRQEDADAPWSNPQSSEFQWILAVIISIVLTYVGAFLYKRGIVDKRGPWQGWEGNPQLSLAIAWSGGVWRYTCCGDCCLQDHVYCWYACLCLGARLGDTYTAANIGGPGYFAYVHAVVAVWLSGQLIAVVWKILMPMMVSWDGWSDDNWSDGLMGTGAFFSHMLLAAWLAGQRMKLREALGDPAPESRWTKDFCCYWWFPFCMAVQEGRQVDEITNVHTKCCFRLGDGNLLKPVCEDLRRPGRAPPGAMRPSAVVGQPVGAPAVPVKLGTAGKVADPK